jgi:hypothetical protein
MPGKPPPSYKPTLKPPVQPKAVAKTAPPVYVPVITTPQSRSAPPVYSPNRALPVQAKMGPPVYKPTGVATAQRRTAPPTPYRPGFAVAAQAKPATPAPLSFHASGVLQRKGNVLQLSRGTNPKKPKYMLSKFAVEVQQKIAEHFNIPLKTFRIKEHANSDFVVSNLAQEILFQKVEDPILSLDRDSFKRDHPEIDLDELDKLTKGVNGLTTEEISGTGDVHRIVHVKQVDNIDKMKCTLVHEGMHAYSNNSFKTRCGADLDEGVTETLAMEVMGDLGLIETRNKMGVYKTERVTARGFITQHGMDAVKAAYFNGTFAVGMP